MPRPLPLPDELLEEVLCRLPPEEPAGLVRAALVCRRWCRLVSDPGFRRRFREFHRSPPMLGMLYDRYYYSYGNYIGTARFIPTTAFCTPRTDLQDMRVLDARHGRVLCMKGVSVLAVWDPITNEVREIPFAQEKPNILTAAVLCSAAAGACDHLDCHQGPYLVVLVCSHKYGNTSVYTYSSDAAAWSEPVSGQNILFTSPMGSALVGNTLYFEMPMAVLKYDLELCQVSLTRLPPLWRKTLRQSRLTTTEDGGLGVINKENSKLYMWSRKDTHEVDAKWERRVIELKKVFPADVDVTKLCVNGSGVGIVFMSTASEVYTIDLKTYKVKKVYDGTAYNFVPYTSFYTPALKGTCTGEGPSAGHSSA